MVQRGSDVDLGFNPNGIKDIETGCPLVTEVNGNSESDETHGFVE